MPLDLARPPIRRSPLESVHASLGATWVDDAARWPESYGDPGAEARAAADGAGLADLGPVDKIIVQGARTREALVGAGITLRPGSVVTGEAGMEAWCLADDEVLLLMPASLGPSMYELAIRLRTAGATVVDLGSGLAVLRLVGPVSGAILAEACPVDLSSRALHDGDIVQASVAGVRVITARQDQGDVHGYTLLVGRDHAEYLWGALLGLGAGHGLVPVGGNVARRGLPARP
jgi:aminomethyltransferase